MLSALILTYNEEANIADCIESLPWRNDVHVLDSNSTDDTVGIANRHGATTTSRQFTNYADQRNAGLALPFNHEWIVMLDADERMTPDLAKEIEREIMSSGPEVAMFRVRRRDIFMGRWLKRSSGYPTWFPRVIRKNRVIVEREINELYKPDGKALLLNGHLDHFPFRKGIDWWITRHNAYSSSEARIFLEKNNIKKKRFIEIFSKDPSKRRQILKDVAYSLPARPFLIFIYLYIMRLGFLDGIPGLYFSLLRLSYEIMIDVKVSHLRSSQNISKSRE